ncbi:chloride channel protein, CIC family [Pedococcus dokdonensis]|uniref:Chloride channel protein, CIC family n=1 Tax=Pedococcus dokdonensis TaxID=443156 RepID=A0A1H0SJ21_9MICO|nr:chloride channel protein [Pedococcus dokdonensis]SDP41146.1 chloride channel protein, CIC family [Pedococcus dokdonensis]
MTPEEAPVPSRSRRLVGLSVGRAGIWLRSSSTGLLVLSLTVGAAAALFAVAFRWLIGAFTRLFSGHLDYAASPGAAHPSLPGLGRWFVLATPVVAGLLYGPLVQRFAREARGHGVPEVMYAVAHRGGRIAPQVAAVKALASALCIGGGGSVGREGPIVQIGSALGSTAGRLGRLSEPRLRVLVACGAAAGISATFNAPLAGVFFAMELILADFTSQAFGMVVLASVTSSVIGRAALGDVPFLELPAFTVTGPHEYLFFAALGLLAGLVGVTFTRVLYAVEDGCDALWRGPEWLRPAVGGLALGLVLLVLPQMYGVGYPVLGDAIDGRYAVAFLLILMVGKMVATSLTIGIGGSGGVFAPSLFIGAMLGAAFGETLHLIAPGVSGPVGAYGLIGMGAVFAGAARAPITAVVMLFELTGEYTVILPLMTAIVLATGLSHALTGDTIYTLKLRRRGVDLGVPSETVQGSRRHVRDVMSEVPSGLPRRTTLAEVAAALSEAQFGILPVVDDSGDYLGVVTARGVTDALADGRHDTAAASLAAEVPVTINESDPVTVASETLSRSGMSAMPVLSSSGDVVGWLSYHDLLAARP